MPDPYTSEAIVVNTNVAIGLTTGLVEPSSGASLGGGLMCQYVLLDLETNDVRFHVCGKTPATACGHIWAYGDSIVLTSLAAMRNFKAANTNAATSTIIATYFY